MRQRITVLAMVLIILVCGVGYRAGPKPCRRVKLFCSHATGRVS